MPDFEHIDAFVAELEDQVKQEASQQDPVQDTPTDKVEDNTEKVVKEAKTTDDVAEDDSDIDEDAASDDAKKRARAFARQRHQAKELKDQLEKERAERQALAERLARVEGRTEATPKVEAKVDLADEEPDADLYPEDHARWELRQLKKEVEDVKKFKEEQAQVLQYQREVAGVKALESQFKANAADYDDAVSFLVEKERRLKKLFNPNATDSQIDGMIEAEKVQLFKQLLQAGRNPAEMVYEIAKQDGWKPKQKQTTEPEKKSNLDKIADNQRRASNIIGGTAAESSGKVTTDQIFSMSMEELMRKPDSFWNEAAKSL